MNTPTETDKPGAQRQQWGHGFDFLASCIAMSIGLGNVWRFPYTAYQNGGGAFLIPYIIVLFLIGKPIYLLEMIIGQFSSRSAVKAWALSPAFKGVAIAQIMTTASLASYYCSLTGLTIFYMVASCYPEIPWAKCREEWGEFCVDSQLSDNRSEIIKRNGSYSSSAEFYFYKEVLQEIDGIEGGIGAPNWRLSICLLISWLTVYLVLVRGVQSAGKIAYFLAIFPYVIMIGLLFRAVTLDGAVIGVEYFFVPDWSMLLDPNVWYAAVSQCFFSLTICFGAVIKFASHNKFKYNIYRDTMIVTTLDTFTSLIAGVAIFGILGNLTYELGQDDVSSVARSGTGLAFISYPEAIVKFKTLPQAFGVLFFVMMFVLGVGSAVALASAIIGAIHDQFPKWKHWQVVTGVCLMECAIGIVYVTPGGQFILTFMDYYAISFPAFLTASLEISVIFWTYGLQNFMDDTEFMLKKQLSIYWKLCWGFVTPLILMIIFIYTIMTLEPLTYNNNRYPEPIYVVGWTLSFFIIVQIPVWIVITVLWEWRKHSFVEAIRAAFRPSDEWGPKDPNTWIEWQEFKELRRKARQTECGIEQSWSSRLLNPFCRCNSEK